jgi:hypothetical protein
MPLKENGAGFGNATLAAKVIGCSFYTRTARTLIIARTGKHNDIFK